MNDLLKYCRELKKCELRFNKNYLYLVTKPQKLFGITKTGEIKENLLPNDMRILT